MDKDHNYYSFLGIFLVVLASITTLVLSATFTEGIISTVLLIILAGLYFGVIGLMRYKSK